MELQWQQLSIQCFLNQANILSKSTGLSCVCTISYFPKTEVHYLEVDNGLYWALKLFYKWKTLSVNRSPGLMSLHLYSREYFCYFANAWHFPSYFGDPNLQSWAMLFLIAMSNKGWIILPASEENPIITGQLSLRGSLPSIRWIMQLSWFWHNCSIVSAAVNTMQETCAG